MEAIAQALDILADPRECRTADIAEAKVILKRAIRREALIATPTKPNEEETE